MCHVPQTLGRRTQSSWRNVSQEYIYCIYFPLAAFRHSQLWPRFKLSTTHLSICDDPLKICITIESYDEVLTDDREKFLELCLQKMDVGSSSRSSAIKWLLTQSRNESASYAQLWHQSIWRYIFKMLHSSWTATSSSKMPFKRIRKKVEHLISIQRTATNESQASNIQQRHLRLWTISQINPAWNPLLTEFPRWCASNIQERSERIRRWFAQRGATNFAVPPISDSRILWARHARSSPLCHSDASCWFVEADEQYCEKPASAFCQDQEKGWSQCIWLW